MGNENKKTASMSSTNPRSNSVRGNEINGQTSGGGATSPQQQQQQSNNLQLSPSFDSIPPWNSPAPATPSFSTHATSFISSPSPFSPHLTLPNAGFLTAPLTSMPFTFPPLKIASPMPPPPPPPPIFHHRGLFDDFEFGRYRPIPPPPPPPQPRHYCCTNYCSHDFHYPHMPLNGRPHASTRHHVNHHSTHHHSHHHTSNSNNNNNSDKKSTDHHKQSHHQSSKQQQQPLRIVCRNS